MHRPCDIGFSSGHEAARPCAVAGWVAGDDASGGGPTPPMRPSLGRAGHAAPTPTGPAGVPSVERHSPWLRSVPTTGGTAMLSPERGLGSLRGQRGGQVRRRPPTVGETDPVPLTMCWPQSAFPRTRARGSRTHRRWDRRNRHGTERRLAAVHGVRCPSASFLLPPRQAFGVTPCRGGSWLLDRSRRRASAPRTQLTHPWRAPGSWPFARRPDPFSCGTGPPSARLLCQHRRIAVRPSFEGEVPLSLRPPPNDGPKRQSPTGGFPGEPSSSFREMREPEAVLRTDHPQPRDDGGERPRDANVPGRRLTEPRKRLPGRQEKPSGGADATYRIRSAAPSTASVVAPRTRWATRPRACACQG